MNVRGHNENAMRLGILADDAQRALERVASGETDTIEGWLAYGAALNEGRAMFPSNEQFGQWVIESGLSQVATKEILRDDRSAAMWAAGNRDDFYAVRAASNARTIRGIHAKWKDLEDEREEEARRLEVEAERKAAKDAAEAAGEEYVEDIVEDEPDEIDDIFQQLEEGTIDRDEAKTKFTDYAATQSAPDPVDDEPEDKSNVRGTTGTGENEWYTPQDHIERARRVMGGIDVDPATSETAQAKVCAGQAFTIDDDGLAQDWNGRVWLNPPYAQPMIADFMQKLRDEVTSGRCTDAIALTHNYTDTKWFQATAHVATAVCFTRGRVKFYSPTGAIAAPTQGQAFFYFGKNIEAFREEFSEIGFVVEVLHGEV